WPNEIRRACGRRSWRRNCAGLLPAGQRLRQGDEIGLRLGQVAGLQILAQLFKFTLHLLVITLDVRELGGVSAGDSCYRHVDLHEAPRQPRVDGSTAERKSTLRAAVPYPA